MSKILLVEDNEANRDMLSRRLRLKGYEVVIAGDGQEALAQTRREAPDLVLMDMSLPVMDGWEATRLLKASADTQAIPVLALTAHAMPQDRERALAAGCDEYDTKPINMARLLGKMEHLLGKGDAPQTQPQVGPPTEVASAHALRTPLNHILGYSELLSDALRSRACGDLVPDLDRIQDAARTLLSLLDGRLPIAGEIAPAPAGSPPSADSESEWESAVASGRILVIDDDLSNRDVLVRLLRARGHRVYSASGGAEALRFADAESFDLILLDIVMPDLSGWEVLRRLKASSKTTAIPVVMISAVGELQAVGRCLQGGARDFISKPIEPAILIARVNACLESRRAQLREDELRSELENRYRDLQESEDRFRQLATSLPQLVWSCQPDGTCDFVGPQWETYTGRTAVELLNGKLDKVIHPEDHGRLMQEWAAVVREGRPLDVEYRVRSRQGEYRWFWARGRYSQGADGRVVRWYGTSTEIHELKLARERMENMNVELERKVDERTAELLSAVERLQGFTYHVSHDLRTPLRAIASTSHVIREDFGERLPTEAHELLGRQEQAATRMGQLVDDLLKVSRLARQDLLRQTVDVTALSRDAAQEALSMHPYSDVGVVVEENLIIEADPRLLRLTLLNLIENGVKYSPSGGTIRVGRRDDGTFFVSDEGIGIEERYFDKIFEPFQRLHRDDEFSGTGIGLSNVKQVVERHGGKVWVSSEPGKGSTFLFTLS